MPVSNEVLGEKISNLDNNIGIIRNIISRFEEKFDSHVESDGDRLSDIEKWRSMVTGALVIMNIIFVPIFIWIIIHLLERKV
jgi:hypothetical protein